MDKVGIFVVPAAVFVIVVFGLIRGVPVFDAFLSGAKEGLGSAVSILPPLVGLVMAVSMLNASGALDILSSLLSPAAAFIGIPVQDIPLALIKPVSGSGSTAVLSQIFKTNGPDSFAGRVASVMAGSTETTFYAVTVYYGAVGIKKTRHTIPAAVTADITACIISVLTVRLFFY
jgi:spore maturation protein B